MGEAKRKKKLALKPITLAVADALNCVETPGGKIQVRAKSEEEAGLAWLREHLDRSVRPLLKAPGILEVDTTVKPLEGRPEGAVIGYHPKKPGRPAHTCHTYRVAGLRMVLDAEVLAGDEGHSSHTLPGLTRLLDRLFPGSVCQGGVNS